MKRYFGDVLKSEAVGTHANVAGVLRQYLNLRLQDLISALSQRT